MRSSWLFLTLAVLPAYASVTYAPVTIETVRNNGVYVARPVSLDTAGFARTTAQVSTMGGRASFPVAVRAAAVPASLALRGAARLIPPLALAAAAYDVYAWLTTDGGLAKCSNSDAWCVPGAKPDATLQCVANQCGIGYGWDKPNPASTGSCPSVPGATFLGTGTGEYPFVSRQTYSTNGYFCSYVANPERPAIDADWAKVGIAPMATIASSWDKLMPTTDLPVDAWTMDKSASSWLSPAYQGADGKWRRDALLVSPSNSSFPAVARVENKTFGPVDDPDLLQLPTPTPTTPQDPTQPQLDLCAINPSIIACAQQEDYYSRMADTGVSSAAITQQQFEESDKKFADAIDAIGAGLPPDNTIPSADAANDDVDKIIQNIDSVNLPTLANIEPPSYSQCKTITFTFKNQPFIFPNTDQCQKIEHLKTAFGYFLAGLVLLSLVWQLLTRPQG